MYISSIISTRSTRSTNLMWSSTEGWHCQLMWTITTVCRELNTWTESPRIWNPFQIRKQRKFASSLVYYKEPGFHTDVNQKKAENFTEYSSTIPEIQCMMEICFDLSHLCIIFHFHMVPHLVCPITFCTSIVFKLSCDDCDAQEEFC